MYTQLSAHFSNFGRPSIGLDDSANVIFHEASRLAQSMHICKTYTRSDTPSLYPEAQVGHGQLCAGMVPRSLVLLASPQGRVSLAAKLHRRGGT